MYDTAISDSFHRKRFPSLKREALGAYLTLISLNFLNAVAVQYGKLALDIFRRLCYHIFV